MIKKFLKSLEKHVKNDKDELCLNSISLGFEIMTHISKGDEDELSTEE